MTRALLWATVLLGVGACGPSSPDGSLVGTYVVDVAETFGLLAAASPGDPPAAAGVRARFAADAYGLDLRGDGTFRLTFVAGPDVVMVEGAWAEVPEGVDLVAATVNGAPATPEEQTAERLARRDGDLVFDDGLGRPIVWARFAWP